VNLSAEAIAHGVDDKKLKAEGFNPSKEEIRTFYDYYFKTR